MTSIYCIASSNNRYILASSIPRLFVNPSSQMYLVKLVEKDFDDQVIYVIC